MPISVLMVCLGNICRSPLAEGALRHHADRLGIELHIDSAGTGDWHIGHPPDKRAQEVARRVGGIDISGLRARQVTASDFHRFDHIIAMDSSNLRNLRALAPADGTARLSLLLDHLPDGAGQSVADPYYGDDADFEACWRQVDAAAIALAKRLASS
jgi:protein-tyrosine phosphatase